jgi:serine/threonine protein kinase
LSLIDFLRFVQKGVSIVNPFFQRRIKMVILNLGKKQNKKLHGEEEGVKLGKYELGRILGEGNFGKVKFARNTDSKQPYAIKIIDKNKIIDLNITNQVCFICIFLLFH